MLKRLLKNKMALMCITLIFILVILGVFAPVFAPNDPYENKFYKTIIRGGKQYEK